MSFCSALANCTWPSSFYVPAPNAPRADWVGPACALFPGMAKSLAATPQDPIHHAEGDVWTHTQMVVDALLAQPEYAALPTPVQGVVFYSALLHDIEKPRTTQQAGDRIVAPGHSAKGAITSRVALWERNVPLLLREQVARLIEAHQIPFFAFDHRRALPPEFTARHLACDRSLKLLCMLARADMMGRVCEDQQKVLDDIELFALLASDLGCLDNPYPFPDPATRLAYLRSRGTRYADEPVFLEKDFEVVMLSGLPASGKSSWAAAQDLPCVSYDDLRDELGFKHGVGTGTIVHAADDKMREFLRLQQPFVVNATHLSKQMRRKTIDLLRAYGAQVRVVYFEATRDELISRNHHRNTTLSNDRLLSMTKRWEMPGLDEVEHVDLMLDWAPRRKLEPGR